MSGRAIRALKDKVSSLPTPGAKLLLFHLMIEHREGKDMTCSISGLARELGVKRDTILTALRELERAGLAVRIGNVIALQLPAETVQSLDSRAGAEPCPATGQETAQPLDTTCPATGQKLSNERTPLKEEEKEREGARVEKSRDFSTRPPDREKDPAHAEIGYREKEGPQCLRLSPETGAWRSPGSEAEKAIFLHLKTKHGLEGEYRAAAFNQLMIEAETARQAGEVPDWVLRDESQWLLWTLRHKAKEIGLDPVT
ncbi:helix-turn-helix domain-containing protein [Qingshengfaniella alkalisoli]|uniref:Helix-turn-helix domain-containing protein n=1 Tax=Qingshengfaniella alkalisoli TaxID=2599296 RepID=A0A5B8J6Q2_9RHOB|nr:helix-turn-helix domain-containing protein [Qingshengfaniella alkalisoli]QDY70117.1 helix-turn-helix domain-containing protein [Qingshengfaniella alkalisoli]